MYEMKRIKKVFDSVVALNGSASLTVLPGEVRALLGSNGSGKSTMIKVLAGTYQPNSGEILCDGKPIHIRSGEESGKHGIATAFQDFSLIPEMSVADNVLLGNEPLGRLRLIDRKASQEKINQLLEHFKLQCDPNAYVQSLMPSTKAMLEVVKAVSKEPKLLLLDEVTASLHYDEIQVLFDTIRKLKSRGMAIVYVTHRMNEIFEICDTITIMRGGETVKEGQVSEFTLDDIVYYMTGRRPETQNHEHTNVVHTDSEPHQLDVNELKIFPKVWDVSMHAYKGEIIGLAGLQGQGQPEFIRVLLGATTASGGTIKFNGKNAQFRSPRDAVRSGIGFVSGDRNREAIFPVRTISENIGAGKIAKSYLAKYITPKSLTEFAKNAITKYNIKTGHIHDAANTLSGGNQQKLVIARWIAMNPDMLLLDDPTKGVDYHSRCDIHETLKECAGKGMTIIISSSDYEELLDIADRIYVFYEGRISDMLTGERRTAEHLVAAMMGMQGGTFDAKRLGAGSKSDERGKQYAEN